MDDYIIREKAVNAAIDAVDDWDGGCNKSRAELIEMEMNKLPAADVKPVVRGKWETVMLAHERMGCRPTAHYCSKCHQITWFRTFFCPNCGADMREENHDNQR